MVTGIVLDEKGQKMSKSKGNIVVPEEVIDKFGADCIRFYFYTINQVDQPKRFSFKDIQDLYRNFFFTLENCLGFFKMYSQESAIKKTKAKDIDNVLDKWIISKLNSLNKKLEENLEKYDIVSAARLFLKFVDDLSNWYIRRSRKRFQKPKTPKEKQIAVSILKHILMELAKLLAPFTPFISDCVYQELKSKKNPLSVHLCDYPESNQELIDEKLEKDMERVRETVALVLAERVKQGIKVRQPLYLLKVSKHRVRNEKELLNLIQQGVNVKKVIVDSDLRQEIELDTNITEDLKKEGQIREIIREIQQFKKELKIMPQHKVFLAYQGEKKVEEILLKNKDLIEKEIAIHIVNKTQKDESFVHQKKIEINGSNLTLFIKIIFD